MLSDLRRELRITSLLTAADMIHDMHQGGMTPDDMDMTEEQFKIFCEENIRTSKVLMRMARKLYKDGE